MREEQTKKTDRRTVYTKSVIMDALLRLLEKKAVEDITVAELCREAELNRGTFYLHYKNITQVVDELLENVLRHMRSVLDQVSNNTEDKCAFPLCVFLRENKKYQPLFFSDSLHSRTVRKIAEAGETAFVQRLRAETMCSVQVLRALFYFQITGCLAVCKNKTDLSDEQWGEIQCGVDRFILSGLQNVMEP